VPKASPYVALLQEVCVRLGFCGSVVADEPLHVDMFLPVAGAVTADRFVECVFRAEGWDPEGPGASEFGPQLREAFVRHMGADVVDARALQHP
jgi:hypothetical protein